MAEELLPPEEEQQQPSRTRFRDTARELSPAKINAEAREGLRDAFPNAAEVIDNTRLKQKGSDPQAFKDALRQPTADAKGEELVKALGGVPRRTAQATAANAKKVSALAKNKKWFIAGGTAIGLLIPIVAFFFWLMLFKNVHIKNLYVTYRWAQFNRGINRSLKEELTKAKEQGKVPKGTAETAVPENATPAQIIESANEAKVGPDKFDPAKDADIERAAKETSSAQQSLEGSSQDALKNLDVERTVKPATSAEDAAKNVADDIADAGKADELGKGKGKIDQGVEDAKKLEGEGKSPKVAASEAADAVIKGSGGGFGELVQKATGPFVVATFYCIFRDIYVSAKAQINQIVLGGASTVAQEVNKTADCQKLGKCSLDQAGAVANKFDNGEESASDSCGWKLAEGSSTAGCKKINPQYTINSLADSVGGTGGDAIKIADQTLDIKSIQLGPVKVGPNEVCPVIMNTWVQGGVAIANLVAIAGTGGSWAAAGEAVAGGVGAAVATSGGKALIAHAILTYGGGLFKDLSPNDVGNLTDMGNLASASATCKAAGCVKATPQQAAMLNQQYRQERIAKNKQRSVLAKFFDTQDSDSVLVRAALYTPTTPQAVVGRIGTLFASITNPLRLNLALGNTSLALGGNTALAADTLTENPYGVGEYVPSSVLYNISADEADSFYAGLTGDAKSALEKTYATCNAMDHEPFIKDLGSQNVASECTSSDYHKFAAAKFNIVTLGAWARVNNNQTATETAPSSSSGATDSTTGIRPGDNTVGTPCPAGTTSAGSARTYRGSNIGLCDIGDNTIVNTSAAKAFYDMKQAAARDGIKLYGGGFRSYEEQVRLRKQNCGSGWQTVPSSSCRPPTAKPGNSNHEVGLAIDFKNSSSRGSAVYQWLAANAARFGIKNYPREAWHWSVDGQ